MPAPPSGTHPTNTSATTPRLRRPPPAAEVDREGWDPQLTEMWVHFPGESGPVFGWFREGAGPWLDTFFGSDGSFRNTTKDAIAQYTLSAIAAPERARPPGGLILHPTLHPQIREALHSRDFLRDARNTMTFPVATEKDWQRISQPGSALSFDYHFSCTSCGITRIVRRMEAHVVDALPQNYEFHCKDVGLECSVTVTIPTTFLTRNQPPRPTTPAVVKSMLPNSDLNQSLPMSQSVFTCDDIWRKRMKFWTGITTYDGSASLVELRGWQTTLLEAYRAIQVPEGRPQVLQATKYLTGEAEKWWRGVAGQPKGQSLQTFDSLVEALERRFIPRSVHQKAIREWNTLRQTGTAEEYMRRVDELATIQPLGEAAEFWHAWEGMRPEIKAEVQFRLEEQGRVTCSRDELWSLMWHAETRYPLKPQSTFFPRNQTRSTTLRAVNITTPTTVCWVCDAQGHRAHQCTKRQSTGCARCGSRAHDLVACPQRPDLRKGAVAKAVGTTQGKGTKKQARK